MLRKQSTIQARNRLSKVAVLARRAGTAGEQVAAMAALERMGGSLTPSRTPASTRLTPEIIRRLKPPQTGNRVHFDNDPAGFGVRVTAAGAKAFVFNYRVKGSGQQRRVTIGACTDWSIGAARTEAKRLRRLVDGGADPRGDDEDQRSAPTVSDLADRFEREHLPKKRPATVDAYTRLLRLYVRPHFGQFKKVADVTFTDVDKLHSNVTKTGSVYSANRVVAVCSKMFSLAVRWQMRTDNPCRGVERNAETKRKRYLSGDELARLTAALAEHPDRQFADVIRLLLLTGARRGEVLGMKWTDLDLVKGVWSKPASATKQKSAHVVPLSEPAVQLLKAIKRDKSEFVFPGDGRTGHVQEIKKPWASLCQSAGITGLRIHDLRHSFASQLVSSGASLALIGALLGHSSPTTTHRYAHLFDDPQRAALAKIGAIVNGGGHHE